MIRPDDPVPTLDRPRRRRTHPHGTTTTTAHQRRGGRNSMPHRLSRQLRPHLILGGLQVCGVCGHLAGVALGDPATGAALTAAAAGSTAGALLLSRRRVAGHLGPRLLAGSIAAASWLTWTAATGPSWTSTAVLAAGGYAASLRWWRRWRIPYPGPDPTPPEGPDPLDPPQLWARHIATDGGPLPGSLLTGRVPVPSGERYDLHLVPGRQSLSGALGVLPKLRTGLRLRPDQDLILEQHPTSDESVLQATIVRRSPALVADVHWPGRVYHRDGDVGTIALGPYVDGDGIGSWLVHTTNRLHGGFLAGVTGSGKSRALEGVALGYAEAGCAVWFGDPQAGASSTFLADHADYTARSIDDIRRMLQLAQRVKRLRQTENALNKWEGWTPDQGRPGLVIIIDESHRALTDEITQCLADELAREGGKVGIVLILSSQVATLDAFGGRGPADAVRSSVCAGNLLLFRSKTRQTKTVLPGVDVDPTLFPRIPGYAYLIDDTGTRRSAPLRCYYLTDDARATAAQLVVWPELDSASAGAAGATYRRRREQAALDMAALAAELAALAQGREPPLGPLHSEQPLRSPAPTPSIAALASLRWSAHRRQATVDPLPPPPNDAAEPTGRPDRPAGATDHVARLLDQGVTRPVELVQRTGYSRRQIHNALNALAAAGRARNAGHGVWESTRAPSAP